MLDLNNLSIGNEHVELIKNFTYSLKEGNIYGIIAPNGSGKTTLFRTIVNLIPSITGTVTLDGSPITEQKNKIFYFESIEWFDSNLSGMDYLEFIQNMYQSKKSIEDVITFFSMESFIKKPIKKYSLGMKQRVLFSLYIISNSKFMLMDEITNGLDQESRELLFSKLMDMKTEGKIIIISSHYLEDIREYCDTILQLSNQKVEVI